MNYPVEILPDPSYKLVDCDLTDYFLIRHFDLIDGEKILNSDTNLIQKKYICSQSDHIHDLSTSLLGVFKVVNIHLAFTPKGGEKFYPYCAPDAVVDIPIFQTEFYFEDNRGFWCVPIAKLHNREFIYNVGAEQLVATCQVMHTPAKWNYWHFSLRWITNLGPLDSMEERLRKNVARKIGQSAIVAITHFAKIEIPEHHELPNNCYCKN
jgi:hypothetical protein